MKLGRNTCRMNGRYTSSPEMKTFILTILLLKNLLDIEVLIKDAITPRPEFKWTEPIMVCVNTISRCWWTRDRAGAVHSLFVEPRSLYCKRDNRNGCIPIYSRHDKRQSATNNQVLFTLKHFHPCNLIHMSSNRHNDDKSQRDWWSRASTISLSALLKCLH